MKKATKVSKLILKGIGVLLLLLVLLFAGSILYGKHSKRNTKTFGTKYQSIVLQGVNPIPMEIDTVLNNVNIYIENNTIVNIPPRFYPY